MVKLIHFPNSTRQNDNSAKKPSSVNQKLKLVVSNSSPASSQKPTISNSSAATSCFTVEVWPRGPNLYEMYLEDSAYSLKCDLILEIEESFDTLSPPSVICYFPNIDQSALNDFVEEDDTLFGMFMIQFQMQILEQLLLFCANHHASKIIIFKEITLFSDKMDRVKFDFSYVALSNADDIFKSASAHIDDLKSLSYSIEHKQNP